MRKKNKVKVDQVPLCDFYHRVPETSHQFFNLKKKKTVELLFKIKV